MPNRKCLQQPVSCQEFPVFPKLPGEIRRRIWHLCVPRHGRIVEIGRTRPEGNIYATTPLPVICSVSREARSEALAGMGCSIVSIRTKDGLKKTNLFLNFKKDTIYINSSIFRAHWLIPPFDDLEDADMDGDYVTVTLATLCSALGDERIEKVERLAVDLHPWGKFDRPDRLIQQLLRFKNLKLLTAIMEWRTGPVRPDALGSEVFEEREWYMRNERCNLEARLYDLYKMASGDEIKGPRWRIPDFRFVRLKYEKSCPIGCFYSVLLNKWDLG
ncbi:hypothetical protein BGZ60DRAFT_512502 [Tricladium varicosporioides]|nr:hypothetical protein BGZ60DRAFT_512502 [Hymenoscyphus varicosporioides]